MTFGRYSHRASSMVAGRAVLMNSAVQPELESTFPAGRQGLGRAASRERGTAVRRAKVAGARARLSVPVSPRASGPAMRRVVPVDCPGDRREWECRGREWECRPPRRSTDRPASARRRSTATQRRRRRRPTPAAACGAPPVEARPSRAATACLPPVGRLPASGPRSASCRAATTFPRPSPQAPGRPEPSPAPVWLAVPSFRRSRLVLRELSSQHLQPATAMT